MERYLLILIILLPVFCALLCYLIKKAAIRNFIVILFSLAMFSAAGKFALLLVNSGGRIAVSLENMPFDVSWIVKFLDFILLLYFAYTGLRLRNLLISVLSSLQLIPLFLFEAFEILGAVAAPEKSFVVDYISLVMVVLVSVIGPVTAVFAIGYMKEYERNRGLKRSKQARFFMVMFVFLGAMNALVMTNNLLWMYFFWGITTLCSFLLISHNGDRESVKNGVRALWMNLAGSLAFIAAVIIIYGIRGSLSLEEIAKAQSSGNFKELFAFALGLLCLAAFTKSAQFPFSSWLTGAAAAPLPVLALLQSVTAVKAGVYLIMRIAPVFNGTIPGIMIATAGGFTFMAGAFMAVNQNSGKRALAYSTAANLGLIICCAAIGNNAALGAAVFMVIFHAVSKCLLTFCAGVVEQGTGSDGIDDMQGLMGKMPFTAVIMAAAMVSVLFTPLGILITGWLAIQFSTALPVILVCVVLGSTLTAVLWTRWVGTLLTMSYRRRYHMEKLPFSTAASLVFLMLAVPACNVLSVIWLQRSGNPVIGSFALLLFLIIIFLIAVMIPYFLNGPKSGKVVPPYLCGENTGEKGNEFTGPGDKAESVVMHNYYPLSALAENKLTYWINLAAAAIILIMFGVMAG